MNERTEPFHTDLEGISGRDGASDIFRESQIV
eukprot:CAMPEP_0194033332 /NCGR_PEP_ID=MMETSP0009_2-20130614/6077_1 /TAXON_ID=210454 /ORGANISM="Grammatophora oceanica, Strain CCMP 410" /LENGTH=31 /DNA_ID= /DNA_START= /DNA_END= /DNA_ORIENTATION=